MRTTPMTAAIFQLNLRLFDSDDDLATFVVLLVGFFAAVFLADGFAGMYSFLFYEELMLMLQG